MALQTKENYLKYIWINSNDDGKISLTEISQRMRISKPTANSMIKKLQAEGWVVYNKYQPIEITAEGRKKAAEIVRRHRLTELYLFEKLNIDREDVHAIADAIEHINCAKLFDTMDEQLGHPEYDPHGSPIPNKNGKVK